MKKFFWLFSASVMVVLLAFAAGCKESGSHGGGTPKPESITIFNQDGVDITGQTFIVNIDNQAERFFVLDAVINPPKAGDKRIIWDSNKYDIVSVDDDGLVIVVDKGTAVLTATSVGNQNIKASVTYIVRDSNYVPVESLSLSPDSLILEVGDSDTITATVLPLSTDETGVIWESSNPEVAVVSNGVVTAVGVGNAAITVTTKGKNSSGESISKECPVEVLPVGTMVPVSNLIVTLDDVEINDLDMRKDDSVTLVATIFPSDAFVKTVRWESANPAIATVEDGVITAVSVGTTKITVTANGRDEDNRHPSWEITVNVLLEMVVFSQGSSIDPGTTTTMPALNANNKFVITNKNSGARFSAGATGSGNNGVVNNTLVYLDMPISGAFTMTARMRITERHINNGPNAATKPEDDNENGVIMGAIAKPEGDPRFGGIRYGRNGQKRAYISRNNNTNTSSALTGLASGDPGYDNLTTSSGGTYILQVGWDEEFIYYVNRSGSTIIASLYDTQTGQTKLASYTDSRADALTGDIYPGFIISGVTVEISQIKITRGDSVIYSTPDSSPTPGGTPLGVEITTAKSSGTAGIDYEMLYASNATLQLAARVLPIRLPQNIKWDDDGLNVATVSTAGLVSFQKAGDVTITASSTAKPTLFAEFKIRAYDPANVAVTGVVIPSTISNTVKAGGTLQFTASVTPQFALQDVTWSVLDHAGAAVPAIATIDANGLLTATGSNDTAATVYVHATSVKDTTKKATHTVNITVPPKVASVNLSGPAKAYIGKTSAAYTASVLPADALQDITWSVGTQSNGTAGDISAIATWDAGAHTLTGVAAGTVYVTVTSVGDTEISGVKASRTLTVTVDVAPAFEVFFKNIPNVNSTKGEKSYDPATKELTLKGRGEINTNSVFPVVYVPVSGDFTAEVEMPASGIAINSYVCDSSSGSSNNPNASTLFGLMFMDSDPGTHGGGNTLVMIGSGKRGTSTSPWVNDRSQYWYRASSGTSSITTSNLGPSSVTTHDIFRITRTGNSFIVASKAGPSGTEATYTQSITTPTQGYIGIIVTNRTGVKNGSVVKYKNFRIKFAGDSEFTEIDLSAIVSKD